MSALIDRINAPAPQKLTNGQKIRIDDFECSMVENNISNDGSLRPQMIIYSDGAAYYAPTPVARKVAEAVEAEGLQAVKDELLGKTLEAREYYSNRWRRMLMNAVII